MIVNDLRELLLDSGRIAYRTMYSSKTYRNPIGTAKYRVRLGTVLIDSFLTMKNMKIQYPGIKEYHI